MQLAVRSTVLAAAVFCFGLPIASMAQQAPEGKRRSFEKCDSLLSQSDSAFSARDWVSGERIQAAVLLECRPLQSDEEFASNYQTQAMFLREQGKATAAMEAAERCILLDYSNALCHNMKAVALADLSRFPEALATAKRASKIALHNVERGEERLRAAEDAAAKEDAQRMIELGKGGVGFAEQLMAQFSNGEKVPFLQ